MASHERSSFFFIFLSFSLPHPFCLILLNYALLTAVFSPSFSCILPTRAYFVLLFQTVSLGHEASSCPFFWHFARQTSRSLSRRESRTCGARHPPASGVSAPIHLLPSPLLTSRQSLSFLSLSLSLSIDQ